MVVHADEVLLRKLFKLSVDIFERLPLTNVDSKLEQCYFGNLELAFDELFLSGKLSLIINPTIYSDNRIKQPIPRRNFPSTDG
jgi:hypothetical protein